MKKQRYMSMKDLFTIDRRDFLKITGVVSTGLLLGNPFLLAQENQKNPTKPKTNIEDALKFPRTANSLPGRFPGKVVEIQNPKAVKIDPANPSDVSLAVPSLDVVRAMFEEGITKLTDKNLQESFGMFFCKEDIIGIKVNPVGGSLMSTRPEVVDVIIEWLLKNGMKPQNIIIWDRFDYMLKDAGFTPERYPGIGLEGIQTMDEDAAEGKKEDNSRWLTPEGTHVSAGNFDMDVYYWADIEAPKDQPYLVYLNQNVFNGKHSYFGKLVTKKLTKIINVPVFKNTGSGVSMATKNLGYGVISNTNRLHRPLFFDVCVEVLAFPAVRDKLVLNITDALKAQYDGGPMPVAKFSYVMNELFFASDPFALDMVCHKIMVEKRKSMGVQVNEHPKYSDYFQYAQRLGLGLTAPDKVNHIAIKS